jgi:SSS family solute:Na+ symporter/sodium/pantothenate symporter
MATVSSYLVVIASGLVRDIYQRFLDPGASEGRIRCLSYLSMILVGAVAVGANVRPVAYLQAIVVFSGTCGAATFVVPGLMAAFWRRATAAGVIAAMLCGVGTVLTLFAVGWLAPWLDYEQLIGQQTAFRPYYLFGLDPIVWGLGVSLVTGVVVSLQTEPVEPARVSLFFDK